MRVKVYQTESKPLLFFYDLLHRTCSISDDDGDMWFKDVQKNIYQIIINRIEYKVDRETYNEVYDWETRNDNLSKNDI